MSSRILFLTLHRKNRSPGQRYRHEQYVNILTENGFECHFSPLLPTLQSDEAFYGRNVLKKILVGLMALIRRFHDIRKSYKFDIVYIYRDAFFFGTFIEKWLSKSNVKIVYDFDDAIWLMDKNPNQGIFNLLKNPEKTSKLIGYADLVITGNINLEEYAKSYNDKVEIIPSTIDFSSYNGIEKKDKDSICIGWTGSFSTIKHFETVTEVLEKIKLLHGDNVYFKLIGDPTYENPDLELKGQQWKAETEAEDLSELDIGIMPLPDNEWTQGKCGMKGLQYMALGIPTIMSPVGVNTEIIQNGVNGFLASSDEEWVEKLTLLIENPELRKKLGAAGRKTVEEKYSVEANKDKWLKAFWSVLK